MASTIDSRPLDDAPDRMASAPSPPLTMGSDTPVLPDSPAPVTTEAQRRRQQRHSKKLSINFPIVLPARGYETPYSQFTTSPTALSLNQGSTFPPPLQHGLTATMPLTPPSEVDPREVSGRARSKSKGHIRQESTRTEFLTLLAAQERRVLELKEELSRAETELTSLKRKWAQYEASKNKTEAKRASTSIGLAKPAHTRSVSVVEVGTGLGLSGVEEPGPDDKLEAERERRRELARERMMSRLNLTESTHQPHSNSKKTGQRVFSSSRHTRALSLLTSTDTTTRNEAIDNISTPTLTTNPSNETTQPTPLNTSTSISTRASTSLDSLNLNLGKTYKDLANASRKNLPPGLTPEQLVKHGKVVVDGVRDGLWTFFEDIRQATVGDEPITGVNGGVRRQTKRDAEPSFWREFGVDTPKSDRAKAKADKTQRKQVVDAVRKVKAGKRKSMDVVDRVVKREGHESKASTDSKRPPSLVEDLPGEEVEDDWDAWDTTTDPDSPGVQRKKGGRSNDDGVVAVSESEGEGERKEVAWHELV